MSIASINNLLDYSKYAKGTKADLSGDVAGSFDSLFQAAVNVVNETNGYTKAAQEAETAFSMGLNTSTSDLLIAQQKANLSLQYTVALRNNVLDSYKEIMNLQF